MDNHAICMKILPYRKVILLSPLGVDDVISRIQDKIGDPDYLKLGGKPSNKLEGSTSTDSFKVRRNITYHNPSIPVCLGRLTKSKDGTTLNILVRPQIFVLVFLFLFNGASFVFALLGILALLASSSWEPLLISTIFLFFGLGIIHLSLNSEFKQVVAIIKEATESKYP